MNQHEILINADPKPQSISPLSQATLRTIGEAVVIAVAFWKLLKVVGLIHAGTKPASKKKGRK